MKSCDLSDIELLLLLELTGKKEEKQALSSVVCSEGKLNDGRSILPTYYSLIEKNLLPSLHKPSPIVLSTTYIYD